MSSLEDRINTVNDELNRVADNPNPSVIEPIISAIEPLCIEAQQANAEAPLCRCLQMLRRLGTFGPSIQHVLVHRLLAYNGASPLGTVFRSLLLARLADIDCAPGKFAWQALVNACAGNADAQLLLTGSEFFRPIAQARLAEPNAFQHAELHRMLVYMGLLSQTTAADFRTTLPMLLAQYAQSVAARVAALSEYLQFCLEQLCFAGDRQTLLPVYAQLDAELRVALLHFLVDLLRLPASDCSASKRVLQPSFVQHLCREFKLKSDCVLKTDPSYARSVHPREVHALLELLATLSADEHYARTLSPDGALFLNVGCLLVGIVALGKRPEANQFTPVAKLGQLAPNSGEPATLERETSYGMKSLLVRTVANLAYRNARNQELAREMDILAAVLDCTAADARNPLQKEWAVLAVRNLCEGCEQNQELVRGLVSLGTADNSEVLKELNLDMGSLRIGSG